MELKEELAYLHRKLKEDFKEHNGGFDFGDDLLEDFDTTENLLDSLLAERDDLATDKVDLVK